MIGTNEMPEIVERDITQLVPWEDNPRTVNFKDMNRLIEQIKTLGVYKPLLVNQNNIILGGNMRFEALKKLGVKKTLCSLVKTDNAAQMMDYALSDNDQIGITDEQKLAEYISKHQEVKSELFAINSQPMKLVSSVLKQFEPSEGNHDKPEEFVVKVTFTDPLELEDALAKIQSICDSYKSLKGISVNDED